MAGLSAKVALSSPSAYLGSFDFVIISVPRNSHPTMYSLYRRYKKLALEFLNGSLDESELEESGIRPTG